MKTPVKHARFWVACLGLTGCSLVGVRTTEEPDYTVLLRDGDIEVRQYDALIMAETEIDGDYVASSNAGFRRLAGYIFGGNDGDQKIAMTAPVIQQQRGNGWSMAFVMPADRTMDTLPNPRTSEVALKHVPARSVAAIRYRGGLHEAQIEKHAERLHAWMQAHGYTAASEPRSAAYDPPWTLPLMRRNEVHIDVR